MRYTSPLKSLYLTAILLLNPSAKDVTNVAASSEGSRANHPCAGSSAALKVEYLDPSASRIIPADAVLECLATGYTWTEGPVWAEDSLYYADIPANNIHKWTPGKGAETFLHPSGYKAAQSYTGPEPGSNGMTIDASGRLTIAGHAQRNVYRLESLALGAPITILADSYQGKQLNSPNDLVYHSDGSLYFTDPPYGLQTQKDTDPDKQLQINGVYRLPHALQQRAHGEPNRSSLQLLISDLPRPNGIAFSPDEKYIYISNSEPKKFWMRYKVQSDGSLTEGKVFYDDSSDPRPGNPDGVKVDVQGNVYAAGPGGVWIFSPEGKPLATILFREKVANLTWAGPDRKVLYITASSSVYRVRLQISGLPLTRSR